MVALNLIHLYHTSPDCGERQSKFEGLKLAI